MDKPAIEGGEPVRKQILPYGRQTVDDADIQAVVEVLRGDWLTTGPAVAAFEQAVAAYCGAAQGVAVSSGTAALHAACHAAGIGQGDEVIVPPITFAATANAVLYCGGTPVFADVAPDTLNISPAAVEAAITPQTKAIIAVDFAGHPADYEALQALTLKHGLTLISDAAHSLGARYHGRPSGALADLSTFSFHPVKAITTGEGGLIVTDDELHAETLRTFRNHGIASDAHLRAQRGDWFYTQDRLGFNYRLPDINCALGLSQLQRLDGWVARRREIAAQYARAFEDAGQVECPMERSGCESAWHLYPIRLRLEMLRVDRGHIFRALRAEGIGVNVHYIPVYWHPYYAALGYARGQCPTAESEYERLISLPLWPGMSSGDVEDVVSAVAKVCAWYEA
jgi:perosamine synthetase